MLQLSPKLGRVDIILSKLLSLAGYVPEQKAAQQLQGAPSAQRWAGQRSSSESDFGSILTQTLRQCSYYAERSEKLQKFPSEQLSTVRATTA